MDREKSLSLDLIFYSEFDVDSLQNLQLMLTLNKPCWICHEQNFYLVKKGHSSKITSKDFKITDSHYGLTGTLFLCKNCGFVQCGDIDNVINLYEDLADEEYEKSRESRMRQCQLILNKFQIFSKGGKLLDVGAGSGIMVETANLMGFEARGIDPSKWLCQIAVKRGLSVLQGTLPDDRLKDQYDVITLIDVLEHVENPIELMKNIMPLCNENSYIIIVTPDYNSLMRIMLRHKWWHFRLAHIGYFNKNTLKMLLKQVGYYPQSTYRTGWYFPLNYLLERINVYIPKNLNLPIPKICHKITVPVNLMDTIMMVFQKKPQK